MSKKSKKGKTIPLTDFLATGAKLVTVRESTWAAIVDEDEEQKKTMVVDMSGLPTAPRSAVETDYSTIPNHRPFVAHVANLSFEIDDENLRRIFADLDPIAARIMRDGMRSRGIGLVEFDTREHLIEALKRTDKEIYGRRIRVNLSEKNDLHQTDSGRNSFGNRFNRTGGGEERPEMADRWKRAERKFDEVSDNRSRNDFNRDRPNRNDNGRSNFSGHSRDGQRNSDYGYGYPRTREDRGNDRQEQRHHRFNNDDDNQQNTRSDRPRFGGRYSDTRDTRDREPPSDDNREPPKARQRLQLQPRTKALEESQPLSGSSSSVNNVAANSSLSNTEESPNINENSANNPNEYQRQESHDTSDAGSSVGTLSSKASAPSRGAGASIFGGARPVDTAAKELEIERKLKEMQMASGETGDDQNEKAPSSRSSYNRDDYRNNDRDNYRNKRSSHNDGYHHNRDRRDDDRSGQGPDYHHKREYSGGRRYEDDSRRLHDDEYRRRDRDRYNNQSSQDDHGGGRSGKYNHHDRDNYRPRDRDTNESNNYRRSFDENSSTEPQSKNQPRTIMRRTVPTEDDSNKLHLSNKFGMLNDENLDEEEGQSPVVDQ